MGWGGIIVMVCAVVVAAYTIWDVFKFSKDADDRIGHRYAKDAHKRIEKERQ